MRKATIFIILIMIFNSVIGQNLNGKWILKDVDSGNGKKGYPGFQLLEINGNKVDIYMDFSLNEKASTLKMENGDLLNYNNEKTSKYEVVNENHIKWFVNGKSNDKDAVFEFDFYYLMYNQINSNKIINIVNGKTGDVIYQEHTTVS